MGDNWMCVKCLAVNKYKQADETACPTCGKLYKVNHIYELCFITSRRLRHINLLRNPMDDQGNLVGTAWAAYPMADEGKLWEKEFVCYGDTPDAVVQAVEMKVWEDFKRAYPELYGEEN